MTSLSLSPELLPPPIPADCFSYTGNAFRRVTAFRESSDGLFSRVSCELAFAALAVAALVEAVVYGIFHLLTFGQFDLLDKKNDALLTSILSLGMTTANLFSKHPSLMVKTALGKIHTNIRAYIMMKCQFFPLDSFDKKWIQAKILSHWLELAGTIQIDGNEVSLEGSFHNCMFQTMAHSLDAFTKSKDFDRIALSKKSAEKLSEAFHFSSKHPSPAEYVKRIQNNELCFLQSGWQGHAICIAFFGNYMAISNRGDGSLESGTLKVYKIDPQLISKSIVSEIEGQTKRSPEKGQQYFSQDLPKKLSKNGVVERDPLCKSFDVIEPMYAPSGNCVLSSIEGSLSFAWAMLEKRTSRKELFQAELEPLLFRSWAALRYAKELKPDSTFADEKFQKLISESMKSKLSHLGDATTYLKQLEEDTFSESSFRRWRSQNFAEAAMLNLFQGESNPVRWARELYNWRNPRPNLSEYDFRPMQVAG